MAGEDQAAPMPGLTPFLAEHKRRPTAKQDGIAAWLKDQVAWLESVSHERTEYGNGSLAAYRATLRELESANEPASKATSTLTLPFVWTVHTWGDATLSLGGLFNIGEVMFMPKPKVWCALGAIVTNHRSTGHADRAAAMAALEAAVKELENGK